MKDECRIRALGIDVGSTTVKIVGVDERHRINSMSQQGENTLKRVGRELPIRFIGLQPGLDADFKSAAVCEFQPI